MPSTEHQTVVELLRATRATQVDEPTLEEQRAGYELIGGAVPLAEDVSVQPVDAVGVPCDWVVAAGADEGRVLLYLHGGGYVLGSRNTHRELASRVSRAAAARVLLVDYRLGPEHPFPAALEDAVAAYRWVLAEGVEPSRLVVAGDSAGGGLTIATLVALRDAQERLPAAAVCLSPWVDLTMTGQSMVSKAEADPIVGLDSLKRMADLYLDGQDPVAPLASPLYADLTGLPPLLVQVGTAEVLLDDAVRLVERARAAGVVAELQAYDDLMHVFQQLAALAPEAAEAVTAIGTFVRRHTPVPA